MKKFSRLTINIENIIKDSICFLLDQNIVGDCLKTLSSCYCCPIKWCLGIDPFTTYTFKTQIDVISYPFIPKDTCLSFLLCNKTLVRVLKNK